MESVARHAIAHKLRIDARAPRLRRLQLFEHKQPRAFADDEAIAVALERPRDTRRLIVARRKRAHGRKTCDAHRRDGRFSAAADHNVGVAALNDLEAVADGMRARGAGGGGGGVRTLRAVADRDLTGRQVDYG